ncbi:MAG: hypothetical protein R3F31_07920 [Verrucomicrobiales bacterium]
MTSVTCPTCGEDFEVPAPGPPGDPLHGGLRLRGLLFADGDHLSNVTMTRRDSEVTGWARGLVE